MKSEESLKTLQEKPIEVFQLDQSELNKSKSKSEPLIDSNKLICISNKKGKYYCSEANCNEHAILCGNDQCYCSLNHEKCSSLYKMNKLNNQILRNVKHTNLGKEIQPLFVKIQDSFSELEDQLINELRYSGLSSLEISLLQNIQQDYKGMNNSEQFQPCLTGQEIKQYLMMQEISEKERLKELSSYLQELIEDQKEQMCQILDQMAQRVLVEFQQKIDISFNGSNILKTKYEQWQLNSFLENELKQNNSSELLFRGTLDGMSMEQFHSKCDDKPNLLYLVENEFGFKYGGYSPCPISINRAGEYEKDNSYSSFVFSLDVDLHATIASQSQAIQNGVKSQQEHFFIAFGPDYNCSLIIGANSFEKKQFNWIRFDEGCGYQCDDDPPEDIQCCGTDESMCKLREVEVYQLKFEGNRQVRRGWFSESY